MVLFLFWAAISTDLFLLVTKFYINIVSLVYILYWSLLWLILHGKLADALLPVFYEKHVKHTGRQRRVSEVSPLINVCPI